MNRSHMSESHCVYVKLNINTIFHRRFSIGALLRGKGKSNHIYAVARPTCTCTCT